MKQAYLAKYPWILARLSLDTLPSIQGYFLGATYRYEKAIGVLCLLHIPSDTPPHCRLNRWTLLWNPY